MVAAVLKRKLITLEGDRSAAFDLARGRLVLLSGVFMVAYMLMAARAVDLTIIQSSLPQFVDNSSSSVVAAQPRADIVDRNGVLLATTLKTETLYIDPKLISSADEAIRGLKKIFPDISVAELQKKLGSKKRLVPVRRNISPEEQAAVLQMGEPGLIFRPDDRRVYPQGSSTSHLVGYSSIDLKGLAGVERALDKDLNEGHPVSLTLDIRLQHVLRRELQKSMKDFNAIGASGVILDAGSGEILAGVSLPDFDSNDAGRAGEKEIFNRLTLGLYELGSVFKIFSTAAYLETHDVSLSKTFDASKPFQVGNFKIHDYHAENRVLTIPEIFMHSSNIGTAMMGAAVGTKKLHDFYERLGLTKVIDFEILESAKPQMPDPWQDVNTVTASFGHGISVTPLHVAAATASIVNGGHIVRPHLVMGKETSEDNGRIVTEQTAQRMRDLMRLVVTDGTGKNADVPGYSVGGKTGTAEKSGAKGYDKNRLISSFVAAFPMADPRYVIVVSVDEPKPNKNSYGYATAGWVAAPAAARIITSMASILGIDPQSTPPEKQTASELKKFISVSTHE